MRELPAAMVRLQRFVINYTQLLMDIVLPQLQYPNN